MKQIPLPSPGFQDLLGPVGTCQDLSNPPWSVNPAPRQFHPCRNASRNGGNGDGKTKMVTHFDSEQKIGIF